MSGHYLMVKQHKHCQIYIGLKIMITMLIMNQELMWIQEITLGQIERGCCRWQT